MNFVETKLSDLIAIFGGRLASFDGGAVAAPDVSLRGIQPLEKGGASHLGFLANPKFRDQLLNTEIGVVLVRESQFDSLCQQLSSKQNKHIKPIAWLVSDPICITPKYSSGGYPTANSNPKPGFIHVQWLTPPP